MDLSIKLNERSYGGKRFRPHTHVFYDKSSNLLLCITPWGQSEIVEKISESIKNFITLANEDSELTVPYARKENLQQMGNILRMAVIMASEKIYSQYNSEEYTAAFEIFAAVQDGPQWIYVSCGQPSLVLQRQSLGIIPLSQSVDMNILTQKSCINDPLPNQLLGLGQHPPINYGNIRLKKSDKLALISRSFLPNDFFKLSENDFNQDKISNILANDNQEMPFWLGFVGFN